MRNLYRIVVILALLAVFLLAFLFVTGNRQLVELDLLFNQWHWEVPLGVLAVGMLALGLLVGLVAGLGLRGVKGFLNS